MELSLIKVQTITDMSHMFDYCDLIKEFIPPKPNEVEPKENQIKEEIKINSEYSNNDIYLTSENNKLSLYSKIHYIGDSSYIFNESEIPKITEKSEKIDLVIFIKEKFEDMIDICSIHVDDISKWDTGNVIDMNYIFFFHCLSLLSLHDITKWNTSNVKD